ncbi:hypothetical protein [Streptomyces antibioticus]|uniref:hypothetical protein n=1 Tax=Streptomyces antibioticus TaxID=1890 RepID=UPI003D708E41
MTDHLLHDDYMDAVASALDAAGLTADDGWTEVLHGHQLEGVQTYEANERLHSGAWPYGVVVTWNQHDGWQYAAVRRGGAPEQGRELIADLTPPPAVVAEAVSSLVAGRLDQIPTRWDREVHPGWEHAEAFADALDEWNTDHAAGTSGGSGTPTTT